MLEPTTPAPAPAGTAAGVPAAPSALPLLARGRHRTPRTGACFMEMASFLAGERWSDHPACTHPLLAQLAREVNDRTSDDARPRLGLLVPSVVGLRDDDPATDARLALLCAGRALPVAAAHHQHALAVALLVGEDVLARLEGRAGGTPGEDSRRALEQVPVAAAWAERFVADQPGLRRARRLRGGRSDDGVGAYRRHGAPSAVSTSVRALAGACVGDADTALHDLLSDAVVLVAGHRPAPAPTAAARWDQACRLTGAGRPLAGRPLAGRPLAGRPLAGRH